MKQKPQPHPNVIDQGVSKQHLYPTHSRQATTNDAVNVTLPWQDKNHRYELRSMNANVKTQSFYFDKPSVGVQDLGSLYEFPFIYKKTHMYSLGIMGSVVIRRKKIAIGVSEVNPLGESSIVPLLFTLRVFLTNLSEFYVKELLPYTHFYIALYSHFPDKSGTTFTRPVFLSKIDHDNDTVKHILSHLNTTYERSNDRYLIYRHIGRHCTNCVLVFSLFTIISLVQAPQTFIGICKKYFLEARPSKSAISS